MREKGYRVIDYVDYFLIVPTPFSQVTQEDHYEAASMVVDDLLSQIWLRRQFGKSVWGRGSRRVGHLCVVVVTDSINFSVMPHKAAIIRQLTKNLLRTASKGRRSVPGTSIRFLCVKCISLTLALPSSGFYTRALYDDLSKGKRDGRDRIWLSHQPLRDLRFWRQEDLQPRPIVPPPADVAIESDAADLGLCGTLNPSDLRSGVPGLWCDQGVWDWREWLRSINRRELRAVWRMLSGALGEWFQISPTEWVQLHNDNMMVVHIVNSFQYVSHELISELRKLKFLLDRLGILIRADLLPSALNRYADALSRRLIWPNFQTVQLLWRSVLDSRPVSLDAFRSYPYHVPQHVGRRDMLQELGQEWDLEEMLFLCPPVQMI